MAKSKPTEELYDTEADPHEVTNLADRSEHRATLERLRAECRRWQGEIIDLGLMPEADLRSRFGSGPEYDAVRRDPSRYPLQRIAAAADLAGRRNPADLPRLVELLRDPDPAVRFWATVGIGALGEKATGAADPLKAALADTAPFVRVATADTLCHLGRTTDALPVLQRGAQDANEWVRLQAVNVLDRIGDRSEATLGVLRKAREDKNQYVVRVVEHALAAADRKEE
jgi:HEAT repeat protein